MQGSKKRYKYKNRYKKWKHLYLNLQERDAGIYECQIPTQPPQSYPINLNIIGQIVIYIINIIYHLSYIIIYYKSYIIFPPNRHSHTPSISTLQVRLSYKHHTLLQPGLLYTSKIISIISQRTMVYVRLTTCRKHNNDIDHDISDVLIISP